MKKRITYDLAVLSAFVMLMAWCVLPAMAQEPEYDICIQSDQGGAHLGQSVANAGDVNGDGYGDVIAAANYYGNPESFEGVVFIFHGSAEGIEPEPAVILEANVPEAHFGTMVSSAGDINGDGFDDVIVGSEDFDSPELQEGIVTVYLGGPEGVNPIPLHTMQIDQAGANYGVSVAGQIDVNADGYDDVIIGAQYFENGQTDEGRVYVYHGSSSGLVLSPAIILESDQAYAYFGREISGAGDVNGDGYDDIIIGADNYDNPESGEGRAYVYHGSPTGILAEPAVILEENIAGANFGTVSRAGDVNNDGYDDVIVGATGSLADKAYVYHGSPEGIAPIAQTIIKSPTAAYEFYGRVADAGDINNDGFDDVIIGSIYYSNGQPYEGGAFVHLGSVSGINAIPYMSLEGNMAYAYFGRSCSGAGDVNGDGYDDLVVGSYGYSDPEYEEGALFFYYGAAATGYCVDPPTGLTYDWDPWYWMMVKFKWDAVPGALAYRVRYKRTDEAEWNYKYTGAGKNRIVIQYWDCFVDYEVQVMAICSEDGTDASPYSAPLVFNTEVLDYCYRKDLSDEMLQIFPNPASDYLTITFSNEYKDFKGVYAYTLTGQLVGTWLALSTDDQSIVIPTMTLLDGIYVFDILLDGSRISRKVVINR